MEITYELDKEDLINFRWYFLIVNPPKSSRNQNRFLLGFVIAIGIHRFLLSGQQYPLANRIVAFIISILFYLVFVTILKRLSALYLSRQNIPKSGFICQHTITLTETELIEKTDVNESHHSWDGTDRVEENDDYLFIFIRPQEAHIIPKRAFETTSEYEGFYEFVKNKIPKKNS